MNVIAECDWNRPGHDPYTGSTAAALSHYDMPDTTRRRLADRIERREYDRVVSATRDGVTGYAGMRNMHFGKARMCNKVDTSKWGPNDVQLGFVFIEDGHHIVKWWICKNITELVPHDPVPPPVLTLIPPEPLAELPPAAPPFYVTSFPVEPATPYANGYPGGYDEWGGGFYPAIWFPGSPGLCCAAFTPFVPVTAVAEPSTYAMILAGLALIAMTRRIR